MLSKVLPSSRVLKFRPGDLNSHNRAVPSLLASAAGALVCPRVGVSAGIVVPPWGAFVLLCPSSPWRLRSRSIMMCRCNALAMALESLGRSKSAGMVLLGSLGLWVPGSVADCKNSDWACGKTGAQSGSRLVRGGGSPPVAPITCPAPATWFGCWPASVRIHAWARVSSPCAPAPFPASPDADPLPTRLLFAFSAAYCAPWLLRHIRQLGLIVPGLEE